MEKNKLSGFHILLIVLTLVLAGGALVFGFLQKSSFNKQTDTYRAKLREVSQMKSMPGAPTPETVDKMKVALEDYTSTLEQLESSLAFAGAPTFTNVKPAQFAAKVSAETKRLKEAYQAKGVRLPNDWHLGFEKYTSVPAPEEATGLLLYQLDALVWLHEELLKVTPDGLVNLYRKPVSLEVEGGESAAKNKKTNRVQEKRGEPLVVEHPIEISFISKEPKARAFINNLVKSEKFLFTVDTIRLKEVTVENSLEESAPEEEDPASEEDAASVFDAIFSEDESGEDDEQLSNEKLFTQVLGKERVAVFLDLNLSYLPTQDDPANK